MLRYILLRVSSIPLVMFVVITIIFSLTHIVPGGAIQVSLGPHATVERVDAFKAKYGLDKPLAVQYVNYIRNILRGNLGESIVRQKPVLSEIGVFLPASIELVLLSTVLIVVIGVPLGVMAATRKDRLLDFASRGIAIAGVSLPSFWLALMLLLVFSFGLHIFPSGGRIDPSVSPPAHITGMYLFDSLFTANWRALGSAILHIILPAFTLAITNISTTTRLTRDGMLKAFKEDYIAMAWAYGLSPRKIYFKYALKNAILPTLTNLGMTMAYLLGGDFIVETVFSFPGIGFYATMALLQVDYAPVAAVAIIVSFLYLCTNLFIDLLYVLVDPRIRF
jgi:peptide/nickel transport system permease protein